MKLGLKAHGILKEEQMHKHKRCGDRVKEKIKTLQELIPNSHKLLDPPLVKVLDDVIEYIKTLEQQVQTMTMGGGAPYRALYMPPIRYQGMLVPLFSPHMVMRPSMGTDIGFGMGMYSMYPPMSAVTGLHPLYGSGFRPVPLLQQLRYNSSQLMTAVCSISVAPSIYVARCSTQRESSSQPPVTRIADDIHHMPSQVHSFLN
ncbi:unnamed protein product [Ilex paraguariensis]|uniref:BHLH domain-containing protein n=1 Tax=Ilex paraguariensis TaxID=185542 RepID=A0ABC8R846_9AQUA